MMRRQLWSLWDLMQKVDFGQIAAGLSSANGTGKSFASAKPEGVFIIPKQNRDEIVERFESLYAELSKLNCNVTIKPLGDAIDMLKNKASYVPGKSLIMSSWSWLDGKIIANRLSDVCSRAPDELSAKFILHIEGSDIGYYDPPEPLFGGQVSTAFPSSCGEIDEAGKCMALGRWTAAVMHLMRALEPALHALQSSVGVAKPKEQWGPILDQIEKKLDETRKSTHGKEEEQWHSEVATHFRYIKDAWRNYAAHSHERYDKERAQDIFNATRALMRQISTRLAE